MSKMSGELWGGGGNDLRTCPVTLWEDWRIALVFTVISAVSFFFYCTNTKMGMDTARTRRRSKL